MADVIDSDQACASSAGSAEDDDYAALRFAYYSANTLMASVSELRVILDITAADYQLLAPLVCVVPEDNSLLLNVNTLTEDSAVLLAAAIPELSEQAALDIIAERPEQGFTSLDELFAPLVSEFQSVAEAEGLAFKVRIAECSISTDFRLLTRILRNFLSNACRYTERGGVLLGARRRGTRPHSRRRSPCLTASPRPGLPSSRWAPRWRLSWD